MKKPKQFNVWSKIRSALRKVWMYSPQRRDALKAAKIDNKYLCSLCKKLFEKWAMAVDHVEPCGPFDDYETLGQFTARLFDGKLMALCRNCHQTKTNLERRSKARPTK